MKGITQARLLEALDKINQRIDEISIPINALYQAATEDQWEYVTTGMQPDQEFSRFRAAIDWHELPHDPQGLMEVSADCFGKIDYYQTKKEKIRSLQSRFRISGVVEVNRMFLGQEIKCWIKHDDLAVRDIDLPKIQSTKDYLLHLFTTAVIKRDMAMFWLKGNKIVNTSLAQFQVASPYYAMAEIPVMTPESEEEVHLLLSDLNGETCQLFIAIDL